MELASVLQPYRDCPLGITPVPLLDTFCCKVCRGGLVLDAAVRVATGLYVTAPPAGCNGRADNQKG